MTVCYKSTSPAQLFYSKLQEQDVAACRLMDRSRACTVRKANLQDTAACLHLVSHTGSNSSTNHVSSQPASQPSYTSILPNINPPISNSTIELASHLSVHSLPVRSPVYSAIHPVTFQSFDCPILHQSIYPTVKKKVRLTFRMPGSETRSSPP